MTRRSVLVLSYYYAPTPSAGAIRMGGLAKYLPEHGWDPTVITPRVSGRSSTPETVVETANADLGASLKRRLGLDPGAALKDQVAGLDRPPSAGRRLRARLIDQLKAIAAFPDTNRGWIPIATRAARATVAEHPYDLLLTTCPPPSVHVAGRRIAKASGLPWIADLRDLWSDDRYSTAPAWRRRIDRMHERFTLRSADALITVSDPLADELRNLHPDADVHTILNGFDPDLVNPGAALNDRLTLTHTGTYHQGRRDPALLFEVVGNLIRRGRLPKDRICLQFFVKHEPWLHRMADDHGVADVIQWQPWGRHADAVAAQRRSHVLLLLHWGGPREAGVVTAKVFEYLAARRPILVLGGGSGALTEILDDTGGGCRITGSAALEDQLMRWWEEFERTGTVAWHGDPDRIDRYSHRRMAREFAEVFEPVVR